MNKAYKYTLTANEHKEITFDVGVNRLAISNANGYDGVVTIVTREITKTKSGDIVSFDDGADAPFADFIVNIEVVQSGSGEPSPTNVRPISGWTGATINVSDEDTSNPTTYNVNWQSTAGTVYGGTLDVKKGVLSVDSTIITLDDTSEWIFYSPGKFIVPNATYDAKLNTSGYISNKYLFAGDGNSLSTEITTDKRFYGQKGSASYVYNRIWVYDSSYATLEEFKESLRTTPLQVLYPHETPQVYHLTPIEIRSLLGVNNVWADCGNISLKYFVQSTQPLIDYINDEDDKCIYIDCTQTGLDTFSITSGITKAEFVSLLNNNKNVKLRLRLDSTNDVIYDLSYVYSNYVDFTYNRTALISDVNTFQSMTLRVDISGDTLSLSRHAVITIGDESYEYITGQNNQLIKDGWSWSTQGYDLRDADELLFLITPMPNVASDSDTINGEMQRSSQDPKRALFCKGIKNMLPEVQEIESPFWFNDIVIVGNRVAYTGKNDIVMKIRVWANYYSSPQHSLADVNFYANCDCNDSTANLWGMCNVFVFKKKG